MSKRQLIIGVIVVCVVAGGMALLWRVTPLADLLQPERIAKRLEAFESYKWSPLMFLGAYVVGGLVMFPVTVLGASTAIVFPPLKAIPISFSGVMLSAALLHWIGARFISEAAQKRLGPVADRVNEAMSDRSVIAIAAIRMIPLAPFTLVNIAAGCIGVRFRDYMLGTALGLAPGITMVCLFGRQVRAFWHDPSAKTVIAIGGVALFWIAMSLGLQALVSRHKKKGGSEKPSTRRDEADRGEEAVNAQSASVRAK